MRGFLRSTTVRQRRIYLIGGLWAAARPRPFLDCSSRWLTNRQEFATLTSLAISGGRDWLIPVRTAFRSNRLTQCALIGVCLLLKVIMSQSAHPMPSARHDQMFPTLAPEEIDRLHRFGEARSYAAGERIVKAGD